MAHHPAFPILIVMLITLPVRGQDLVWPTLNPDGVMDTMREQPGWMFVGSALVPGLGQAANKQWWKTAVFAAVEAGSWVVLLDQNTRGRTAERRSNRYGNANWSVVNYAGWVHAYYHAGGRKPGAPDVPLVALLTPAGRAVYNQTGQFPVPAFDNATDWSLIDIRALRDLEKNTIYLVTGREFSHTLPDYGSQQYYELMSKYPQFGPGWRDWNNASNDVNRRNEGMPDMWFEHARMGVVFNDHYRLSSNMASVILLNHMISAFDAYFTVKIRNARIEQGAVWLPDGGAYHLRITF
jgi:hypothetical protein